MAARTKRIVHDENTRKKIQASQIINRLNDHILGKVELSATQVTAALGLLKKTLPDLQSIEVQAEVDQVTRVINAQPLSEDEWSERYGNDMAATTGATSRPN